MKLYSTNNPDHLVDLKEAVLRGLPADNGLYMPCHIPTLKDGFISSLKDRTLPEIAIEVCKTLFDEYIGEEELVQIIETAINFPAPIVSLDKDTHILELFHGPSMAFKDFGARFMGQLMGFFNQGENKELNILVATSGDTGGAVAAGFLDAPGINVYILYPSGKVSDIQEQQLTTLGKNITALEVNGTFDDCQALVKSAFLDKDLRAKMRLASANSINIARLIPQSFYYFEAYKQLEDSSKDVVFSIPSGNFGNLTAGVFAYKMGLPVKQFLAATNINDIIPQYLSTGEYCAKPSMATISNAMDVGDPSNYKRLADIFKQEGSTWNNMKELLTGYSYNDELTRKAVQEVYNEYNYIIDPHGAIGYRALKEYQKKHNVNGVVLETAHYAKFKPTMDKTLGFDVPIPDQLSSLLEKEKVAKNMTSSFEDFKSYLLAL